MRKVREMDLGSDTNHFFAVEEDPSSPMLELTDNNRAGWKGVRSDAGSSGSEPTIAPTHARTAAIASESLPMLV